MNKVVEMYKNIGETPLEALDRFRLEMPEYKDEKLSYAGRLDPLAEGVMLVLVGEANKEREKYLGLDKVYEVEMLLGVATDTYDLLGLVTNGPLPGPLLPKEGDQIQWNKYVGKFSQDYPPYSSKTVNGKPMFEYAREGKLEEIEIPTKEVEIYSIVGNPPIFRGWSTPEERGEVGLDEISVPQILNKVKQITTLVKGDFRQKEILESWGKSFQDFPHDSQTTFPLISFKISCSSGTYIRSLVHRIGTDLGCGACVWKLKRTKIISP